MRYQNEIMEPDAIPYLQNLGPKGRMTVLSPTKPGSYLKNLGVERMEWLAVSLYHKPIEILCDQLRLYMLVTNTTTLVELQ